jgi:hypothetical protein
VRIRRRPAAFRWAVRAAAFALCLAARSADAAPGAELYGKPLRGLTRVPLATLVADPSPYFTKPLRVGGAASGAKGTVVLAEDAARLALETDGSFTLPEGLDGARLTAEGRLRKGEKDTLFFVATGVEVRR